LITVDYPIVELIKYLFGMGCREEEKSRLKIIGFVGMPGSGKSVASDVARSMGFEVVVMGDVIRHEAARLGLSPTDENLGRVGNRLRACEGPKAVAKRTLEWAKRSGRDLVVVDGLRSKEEVESFRASSDDFHLVEIWAPTEARLKRIAARGRSDDVMTKVQISWDSKTVRSCQDGLSMTTEALEKRECRELGWGMCEAFKEADLRINNEGDLDEFRSKVASVLKQFRDKRKDFQN
jgi:dephospho-CoA kinase